MVFSFFSFFFFFFFTAAVPFLKTFAKFAGIDLIRVSYCERVLHRKELVSGLRVSCVQFLVLHKSEGNSADYFFSLFPPPPQAWLSLHL
jgi:hypothetical protein